MNRRAWSLGGAAVACAVSLLLAGAGRPAAGEPAPAAPLAGAAIGVHGEWTVEVRDPDGTLIGRREFRNALTISGQRLLVAHLRRLVTPGLWAIVLGSASATAPCDPSCTIVESAIGWPAPAFRTLIATVRPESTEPLNDAPIELFGTAVAARTGQIDLLQTYLTTCASTVTRAACRVGIPLPLAATSNMTSATLGTPISLTAGQQVAVLGRIRFATDVSGVSQPAGR